MRPDRAPDQDEEDQHEGRLVFMMLNAVLCT